jgi:glycosyltransferase involved in cell wall biosynthesis
MGQDTAVTTRIIGRDSLEERRAVSPFGVLLVGNFLSAARPGSCTVCELLAGRLSSAGWPVLTTSDKSARLSRLADMLITVWRRRREYAVAQLDVYSGPSFMWAESVCWLLGRLRKPFVLTLHGGNLPAFARRWPGRVRRLLNSASVVTTPSRYLQQALSAYRDGLLLLPNAIDLASYPFRLRSNAQPKLIWLRALHGIYNPCMAVRAIAELVREFPDIQLTMYGPDKGDGSLEQVKSEVKRLGLEGRISLPGFVSKTQVPIVLNSGDIFLNTTNVDNTPVSVIEAMACGLCVVSTNAGGLPYLLDDEQDSLLVQADDPAAMATTVSRILREPALAERLSRNARAKAERFDWSVILPQWETLLIETAAARSV